MRSPSATRSTDTSSSHSDATDESSPFGTQAGSPTSSFMTPVSTLSSRPSTPPPRSDVENDPYTPRSLASKETVNSMISSWRPSPMPTPGSFPGSPFNSPKKPGPSQSPTLGSPFHSPEKRVVDHKKVQQVYELLRYASDRQDSSEKLFKDRVESVLSETSTPPDDARSVKQSEHSRFIQERSERAQREWLEKTAATRSREDLPTDPPIQHCALPAWLPYLMAGITHQERSDKCRQINATNLVRRGLASRADGVWNGESMVALVEQFCWAASEEFSLTSGGTVAPFARAVSSEMRKSFGEERAQTFERFLQDSTMRMFSALWIIHEPIRGMHPRRIAQHVYRAMATASFIGDLQSAKLLTGVHVQQCLAFLLEQAIYIEHIHAIHAIVVHADATMLEDKDSRVFMRRFMKDFEKKGNSIEPNMSIMGCIFDKTEAKKWTKDAKNIVKQWFEKLWNVVD